MTGVPKHDFNLIDLFDFQKNGQTASSEAALNLNFRPRFLSGWSEKTVLYFLQL